MARLKKRFDEIDRAMQEEAARRGQLAIPAELGVIALVSPETKQPVEYYDLQQKKFFPAADYPKGNR